MVSSGSLKRDRAGPHDATRADSLRAYSLYTRRVCPDPLLSLRSAVCDISQPSCFFAAFHHTAAHVEKTTADITNPLAPTLAYTRIYYLLKARESGL